MYTTRMAAMEQTQSAVESEGVVQRVVNEFKESILLKLAVFGVLEIALAYLIELAIQFEPIAIDRDYYGVWVAILTLWGMGLIVIGTVLWLFVWYKRR